MKFSKLQISGVYVVDMFHSSDERGSFTKTFHKGDFEMNGMATDFAESFFSTNKKGVIRGMHFQLPPFDHEKLVYATKGRILDVILDIRKSSSTYGKAVSVEISDENHKAVYLPKGVAHGFCCLTEATMVYLTSTVHNSGSDSGIRWDSFGFDWPENKPIISDRDLKFESFTHFISPFK